MNEIEYKGESVLGKCWERLLSFLNYINLVRYCSRKFGSEPIRNNPLPIRRTREISLDDLERELMEEIDHVEGSSSRGSIEMDRDTFEQCTGKIGRFKMDEKYPRTCPMCNAPLYFRHMMGREFHPSEFFIKHGSWIQKYSFTLRSYLQCYQRWKFLKDSWKTYFKIINVNGRKLKVKHEILCCTCYSKFNKKDGHVAIARSNSLDLNW